MKNPDQSLDLSLRRVPRKGALSKQLNQLLATSEVRRAGSLLSLLNGFHLKYTTTSAVDGRKAVINGHPVTNFGSANYLGLDCHPEVIEASREALLEWGNHSGCSRVFSSHENMIELEAQLAALVGAESAIVYPNTSSAHIGTVPALFARPGVVIFLDRYAHTSMHQAAQIAVAKGARICRVDIRDLEATAHSLQVEKAEARVLMIDGVYSMQGTVPDLRELQDICDENETILYIDDAHGIAVYGDSGGGVVEAAGLSYDNMILVGGLQKGLGAYGGFVAGSKTMTDLLRVSSRSYIFSGTLQPHAVEGSLAAIRICRSAEGVRRRARLAEISRRLRTALQAQGYEVQDGDSPIVSVLIGPELRTLMAGRKIFDEGSFVNSVLYPATPRGEGLLRISLSAIHTDEEIAELIRAFKTLRVYLDTFRNPLGQNLEYAKEFTSRQLSRCLSWFRNESDV